jgi:ketosteroid isomerase-like protein
MFSGCKENKPKADKTSEITKIGKVLEKYILANENQDFNLIQEIWSSDSDNVMIGTDSDERYIGWDQIKKAIQQQFSSFEDTYISIDQQDIRMNDEGNTAWFYEVLNYSFIYNGVARRFEGIRFTGVMINKAGEWKLVQEHLSIPAEKGRELK